MITTHGTKVNTKNNTYSYQTTTPGPFQGQTVFSDKTLASFPYCKKEGRLLNIRCHLAVVLLYLARSLI